jgi:peptide-methionine (S)-S-oxide reductase
MHVNEQAVVAGGCFWCTEAVFRDVVGVSEFESGYIGGHVPDPTYKDVCSGSTGHAEAIRVTFDPAVITLPEILDVFLGTHDPTQLNRQGNDRGPQYRSAIFYADEQQRIVAEAYIRQLEQAGAFKAKIVTTLEPLKAFYEAEGYHQDYAARNPGQPYIAMVAAPKVEKLRAYFGEKLKR